MLLALLLAVACSRRGVADDGDLYGRRIVGIAFDCAEPIDVSGLTRLMPMHVGAPLRAEDVEEARWRLRQKNIFTRIDIVPEARGNGVAVVIHLVRQAIVNAIRFRGNEAISSRELRRLVRVRENASLTEELRAYSVQRMHAYYVAQGFDDASVRADVETVSPGEADVIFRIHEGAPLHIGAIDIVGELPLQRDTIRKAIGIEVGDRYQSGQRRTAEKAIIALFREHHYYEADVDAKWEAGKDKRGTLRFTIDPGPLFTVEFSGNDHFGDEKLLGLMDFPKRPIVTDGTWRELARRVQQAYQEDGYYFATVDLTIEAGPPKLVHFSIKEGRTFHVAAIRFEGNHGLSDGQLVDAMATRPPSWIPWRGGVLIDSVLDDDLKRLWYLYREHGYESAEIVDDRPTFDHDTGEISLTVVIEEGPQTVVRAVERSGLEPIVQHVPALTVKVGDPLDRNKIDRDRQALLSAFATAGYTKADVKTPVTTERAGAMVGATVHFDAVAGPRQRVGTIIVQDNIDTRSNVIIRELPFKQGDPLDPAALLEGQSNIYKLRLFRSVTVRPLEGARGQRPPTLPVSELERQRVPAEVLQGQAKPEPARPEPERGGPNSRSVAVTVSEKPPGSLQWGAGYNTRDGFRGFLEVSHDNLQGSARRASLRGEFNLEPGSFIPNEYLGNLGLREPHLDGTKWTFRSNLIAQRSTRRVDQFSLERFALIPAIERFFLPGLQAGIDAQLEQVQIFDLAPDVLNFNPRDAGRLRTVSFGPFMVYDGRDDAFLPRRGVFDSLRLRLAPSQFADIPFFKLIGQHTQYVPLGDDLTFVYVVRGGYARPFNSGDIVPIRERFFLGGRTTVRGFSENGIGPQGARIIDALARTVHPGGDPLGGDLTLNTNMELRFPLLYGFGGVVFVDGGGVYFQDRDIRIDDFRRSTGLGLRYLTPVGPVSLDYGFKLDRRTGESVGEVHFSIGTIF